MKKILGVLIISALAFSCEKEANKVVSEVEMMSCDYNIDSEERNTIETIDQAEMLLSTKIINGETRIGLLDTNNEFYMISNLIDIAVVSMDVKLKSEVFSLGTTLNISGDVKEICSESFESNDNSEVQVIKLTEASEKNCEIEYELSDEFVKIYNKFRFIGYIHEDKSISYPPCSANDMSVYFSTTKMENGYYEFQGQGPINQFSGSYLVQGDFITYGEISKTHIGADFRLVEYENQFFNDLFGAREIELFKNVLYMPIQGSTDKLMFVKM